MKNAMVILFSLFSLWIAGTAAAVEYPVIKSYGPVTPLPGAAVQPDKSIKYKVLFDVTAAAQPKNKANSGLGHVARFINVMASAGMDCKAMDLVVIVHGGATPIVLSNAEYKQKYGVDNPNMKLVEDLKKAAVKLLVCGQALSDDHFEHKWVSSPFTIALSALVVVPTYQLMGYAYQPFF